ncbi:NAD(P)/FAD-dependent oxidoreductase [Corynebacterium freneyi]|uniref:flavin-containing monooxygenase n=1 Tax=Corynebacterium freneyi TaxID=134034 RepID=UPI00254F9EB8|nr:NAD(P)/FAD-dependent oxidoreductase [Corynebacterium freneyi]MDK8768768.1 NAD(P)/FAD-dependent oxidoreductase [Corynebacterium freneyi]
MNDSVRKTEVLIVGAGFSGITAGVRLLREGIEDFQIIDRGHEVGGTWRDNTYPGAACDVPSHLYSLSFAQNFDWSRSFGTQPEIADYQRSVAVQQGLYPHIRFRTEMVDARWDDAAGRWLVTTREFPHVLDDVDGRTAVAMSGELADKVFGGGAGGDARDGEGTAAEPETTTWSARELVLGVGALCEPRLPDIEGIGGFEGTIFHSSRWDHDADLRGKRVAVIGTGASAIQIIPKIAPVVGHLDVYQRTAPYVIPRLDRAYAGWERAALRNVPGLRRVVRAQDWFFRELQIPGLTKNDALMAPIKGLSLAMLRAQVRDRKLREKLTPKFTIGCKRMLISNTYYPAIARDNVELVTDPIQRVNAHSITTADGTERPIDVLIVCTGFHVTDSPTFELVHGRGGESLAEAWRREGMSAHKGTTIHGYPNLSVLMGPATGLGHSSMIYMIESQANYFMDMLRTKRRHGADVAEVSERAQGEWNDWIRKRLPDTVWVSGCGSWYLDDHGNAPAVWPSWTWKFRLKTRKFDASSYDLRVARPALEPSR